MPDWLISVGVLAAFGAFVAWRKGWLTKDMVDDIFDGDDEEEK